jgi:hypothetical protein
MTTILGSHAPRGNKEFFVSTNDERRTTSDGLYELGESKLV